MYQPVRRIVAGVATLTPHDPALTAALSISSRTGAELRLLHVESSDASPGAPVTLSRTSALRGLVESVSPGVTHTGRVLCSALTGDAERLLRDVSSASFADLLVLGATRRGALAGAVLGTTATRVLRTSRTPMLVARGALPDRPLRVLLTTDLSRHSLHAHARGLALARSLGGPEPEFRTLFVQPPDLGDGMLPAQSHSPAADAELQAFLAAEVPPAPTARYVRTGDPAYEIVREAEEWQADLIVVGTHGRRGARRVFLGSVAETVLRHAPCAALVVPPVRLYSIDLCSADIVASLPALTGNA
ncbi:MAG TPA: universal stress protein [Longimicrobium sp.]|nr:universal stress protein [Longimicrobium sp.]